MWAVRLVALAYNTTTCFCSGMSVRCHWNGEAVQSTQQNEIATCQGETISEATSYVLIGSCKYCTYIVKTLACL